jgi:cobalt-zinc-cadmium efflux system membrane fusion protein
MKNIIYIIVLFLGITFISCKENKPTTSEETEKHDHEENQKITISDAQFKANKMQLGTLTKRNFPEVVKATGSIDVPPQNKQIVTSFYGGTIVKSHLLIGDKVRKGQVLVTIENPEFVTMQQEYLEVKENLDYLKNEYQRQKTLFDEKITSQKKYLQAKSKYNSQLAMYNGLKGKLQMLNIHISNVEAGKFTSTIPLYAKINGFVTKVNVSTGTYIEPNDVILEIVNTDHIHVELTVFEKDVMKIKKGQQVDFKIPEASNQIFKAEVHLVGTSIDPTNRTIKVHGHLHNETKNNFAIGMFVEANIITKDIESLALPEKAVVEVEGENKLLRLAKKEDNTYVFEPVPVKIGNRYNGYVSILSENISLKDKILIKGAFDLLGEVGEDDD